MEILQDKNKFCYGIDAYLLADFAKAHPNEEVFDLGTGTGIIPFLMSEKTKAKHFTALEIQKESVELAQKSVKLNGLEERIEIVEADICKVKEKFESRVANVVVSNPPYMTVEQGKTSPNDAKSIARTEILCNLEDVICAASYLLKPCGRFYMIHRPNRLSAIFNLCAKYKLEPKTMQLVYPYINKTPTMVMIEARKDARPDLIVQEPLIVRNLGGQYTKQVLKIYENWN